MKMEITGISSGSQNGNCYHIEHEEHRVLLDCGPKWRKIKEALKFKTSGLSSCLVTHMHHDHCDAVADIANSGIDVYAPESVFEEMDISSHRTHNVSAGDKFNIDGFTVKVFESFHDVPTVGYALAGRGVKLIYITDTPYIKARFDGFTHVMIEANYDTKIIKKNVKNGRINKHVKDRVAGSQYNTGTHMSIENTLKTLKANDLSNVEEVWLLHLSSDNSDKEDFKRRVQQSTGKPTYLV